jgi:hypothetical protein
MRKRIVAMMMALMMVAGLAGCGSTGNSTVSSSKGNSGMTLSEAIHDGKYSIWYGTSAVNKDNEPRIYVLYDDGTCISGKELDDGTAYTFKELSEMSDEDIVSFVQSVWNEKIDEEAASANLEALRAIANEKGFGEYAEYYISGDDDEIFFKLGAAGDYMYNNTYFDPEMDQAGMDAEIEDMLESDFWISIYQSNKEQIWTWFGNGYSKDDEFYQNVKAQYIAAASAACDSEFAEVEKTEPDYERGTYTITAKTDATGNNIQSETIEFSGNSYGTTISSAWSPQAILECYYGGYKDSTGSLFVIRTGSNTTFTLDTTDTKGITVD